MTIESIMLGIREIPETGFKWYMIGAFAVVVYVYAAEVEKRNWSAVFAGLAFFGMDLFNEWWNALIPTITGGPAFWECGGDSTYIILVGLNIEISFMFLMAGIAFAKMLPEDKNMKIDLTLFKIPIKIPNRLFFAIGNSIFAVFIEILLNAVDALLWDYPFWNSPLKGSLLGWIPIVIFGYLHFNLVSFWVYDMESRKKQMTVVGFILAFDIIVISLSIMMGWV